MTGEHRVKETRSEHHFMVIHVKQYTHGTWKSHSSSHGHLDLVLTALTASLIFFSDSRRINLEGNTHV
jgi:hypothetical protein